MIGFPNCKINLGLNILNKRPDGFHDLSTLFYPLKWSDCLEIIPATNGHTTFSSTGLPIPPDGNPNICERAYSLLQKAYKLAPVNIHLHKVVPMGAGLGGGSSDGAFTLKMLNELFQIGLSVNNLKEFAAQLGSDCPFFIENTPSMAAGRGELLIPVSFSLKGSQIVVVNPGIHVGTREAFAGITPVVPSVQIPDAIALPREKWKDVLINDFEKGIFNNHPEIAQIKDKLYEMGAYYAAMSGSGSSVFGLFDQDARPDPEKVFPQFTCWVE